MSDPVSSSASRVFVELVPGGPVEGSIRPPGSKSLTNRALVCAAFADGPSRLSGALASEDTAVMIAALRKIGVAIEEADNGRRLTVHGRPSRPAARAPVPLDLFIANSGTTVRFLTAALSAAGGHYRLHGVERMHARPIGDLVEAIRPVLEGDISTGSPGQCPPVTIDAAGWRGGAIDVRGNVSSQYLSGLMMAAPISGRETQLRVHGELVSRPYVSMTARVMEAFGVEVRSLSASELDAASELTGTQPGTTAMEPVTAAYRIANALYRGRDFSIEPDASAASYFWAAAAISGGEVTVEGLSRDAIQGDVGFCDVLERMGCRVSGRGDAITVRGGTLRGVEVDMNAISDTVQTLAVVALFADSPTRVRGVAHNRFKETDRIGDLARELRKFGAGVEEHPDGLTIVPPSGDALRGATCETYRDHRMAMSLSLVGLRVPGVRILDPACTAKTYPEFFADLEALTGRPHRWA